LCGLQGSLTAHENIPNIKLPKESGRRRRAMMTKSQIGLTDKARRSVAKLLNVLLADEYILYTQTRNYHWNVVGPRFHDLHKFFEAQYEELDDVIDGVAERVRALGASSAGSLGEFLELARIKESSGLPRDAQGMVGSLLATHEALIRSMRTDLETADKLGDAGTNDFLTGLMERHEKMAWMLRATLERG
jgi:starvation-inducible DNA-binding protein